jgi:hypothetical protein
LVANVDCGEPRTGVVAVLWLTGPMMNGHHSPHCSQAGRTFCWCTIAAGSGGGIG